MSGGISGSASLMATWLKPQLAHNSTASAAAAGGSARSANFMLALGITENGKAVVLFHPLSPVVALLHAMGADSGYLDDRGLRLEAGALRRRRECRRDFS